MEYNKLVSVTGLSGLFELISSKADGGVVRSLEDNTTKFVSNRIHQFSHLESIEIYTTGDNVNLVDVLTAMKSSSEKLPDANDAKAIKAYFEKIYPSMDFERVYGSDMKKMVKWFSIIDKAGIEIKLSDAGESVAQENIVAKAKPTEQKTASVKNNAPAKKINTPRKMA
ncbi:MAG: DUF5606 domain-containing protein [Chitinophagaceae bacterium]|nr:DUF5606 domain-containing protein [Chitinophagaceae bacterium]